MTRYNQPAQGTTDWHVPINENFAHLATDVERRDTDANRDQYDPATGAKFLATDTGDVYLGDGDQWAHIGSLSAGDGQPGPTATTADRVIVATDASEIQPAIDALTEQVSSTSSGDRILGGVVQLLPKAYYPTDSILLKAGVTLQGALPGKQGASRSETSGWQGTTLYTSQMPEGPAWAIDPANGTHSYRHFNNEELHDNFQNANGTPWNTGGHHETNEYDWMRNNTHPHLPVILAFNQLPTNSADTPTQYQQDHWGDGVGLRNLTLKADQKRYWDPANETDALESPDHERSPKKEAYYFGVYDGIMFENLHGALIENVHVEDFQGYSGFYQDIRNVISRGNTYSGTATDHHGTALVLGTSSEDSSQRYMRGQWSVRVEAPTPCVTIENHAVNSQFVTGGWTKNAIIGDSCEFLSATTSDTTYGETNYDNGEAIESDPAHKDVLVHQPDGFIRWDGYVFDSGAGGVDRPKIAYLMDDSNTWFQNCLVGRAGSDFSHAIKQTSQDNLYIVNCELSGSQYGIETFNDVPTVVNSRVEDVYLNGKANVHSSWVNAEIDSVDGSLNKSDDRLHIIGGEINGSINDVAGWQASNSLKIQGVKNYRNVASGSDTVSDSGTITHGIDETPAWAVVKSQSGTRSYVSAVDGTTLTVQNEGGGTETVYWAVKGWSAPGVVV